MSVLHGRVFEMRTNDMILQEMRSAFSQNQTKSYRKSAKPSTSAAIDENKRTNRVLFVILSKAPISLECDSWRLVRE